MTWTASSSFCFCQRGMFSASSSFSLIAFSREGSSSDSILWILSSVLRMDSPREETSFPRARMSATRESFSRRARSSFISPSLSFRTARTCAASSYSRRLFSSSRKAWRAFSFLLCPSSISKSDPSSSLIPFTSSPRHEERSASAFFMSSSGGRDPSFP